MIKQILSSRTSIRANEEEAVGGISKKEFRAKMSIVYKESRKTDYWLQLLKDTEIIEEKLFNSLYQENKELLKIPYKIIKSSEN